MDTTLTAVRSDPSMPRTMRSARRVGTTRERLGCLTCRHRRKKCDELYPICGHCRRLNLVCKREEPRQIVPEIEETEISTNTAIIRRESSSKLPRMLDVWSLDPEKSQDRKAMLGYYTSVLAVLLTTNFQHNSFLSVFLPMAIESKTLQMSLVAWSSAHLSRLSKSHEIAALENHHSAVGHIIRQLRTPPTTQFDMEIMLASCLVLCATEIASGDTKNWYEHLLGAKLVISSARGTGPGGTRLMGTECFMRSLDGQWLLRNFAYHDVLGSVTSTSGPLLKGAYWVDEGSAETIVDSYVGIGAGVLAILSEVTDLDMRPFWNHGSVGSEDFDVETEGDCEPDFWQASDELEFKLQNWTCPKCSDVNLVDLAEAYRHAALIVLYRKQRSFCLGRSLPPINSKIAQSINSTMTHIQQIPAQSLPECGILFPLFMVGGDTLEAKNIELVRTRLQTLLKERGFGNIAKAQEVLEELWRLRVSGTKVEGREIDWMDILERKQYKLILS